MTVTNTQEFLDIRNAFEALAKRTPALRGSLEREGDAYGCNTPAKGVWYANGTVNTAFHIFLAGWSAGRGYERQETM
jgi:hypothetical protein